MPYHPRIKLPGAPSTTADFMRPQARLALAVFVSAAAHLLWLALLKAPPVPRHPSRSRYTAPLRLTLVPAKTRVAPPSASTAPAPSAAPPARRPARKPVAQAPQPSRPDAPALPAAPQPTPQPAPAPATPADAPPPTRADILAAATRDAAVIARELNHAPGAPQRFRPRMQEELDRRFDAAHAAGGRLFQSAHIDDITTAADGNTRVYRIVTPLGSFCRTYPADGSAPMNTTCPR
ncbi:hypothetical protein [Massilia rhizosphaerae]|uniref:hypothetical protein n=1 Tax=Massilia rhizosphaerae TaxID=2784389 RepID=UPI0018DC74FC|nr:hypothetical protein [Massilia rhizosphaerae]